MIINPGIVLLVTVDVIIGSKHAWTVPDFYVLSRIYMYLQFHYGIDFTRSCTYKNKLLVAVSYSLISIPLIVLAKVFGFTVCKFTKGEFTGLVPCVH